LIFGFVSLLTLKLGDSSSNFILQFDFLKAENISLSFSLLIDTQSLIFMFVLLTIVSAVFRFSQHYMQDELFNSRFNYIVILFVLSMLLLILIPELIFTLIGWDGLGLTRFLLIIYYLSDSSWVAGMKTYLINRLGDGLIIVSCRMLIFQGRWGITTIKFWTPLVILLLLGCFTKSAQFPFSTWLPDAMAAPTPVSALVHSRTLVTAGVYLMFRFSKCLRREMFFFIGIIGFWSLILASLAACIEYDSKKIIAYSTLSQLGLMFVSLSLGLRWFCYFHLLTHAVFKALLFISMGYKIMLNKHSQDTRLLNSKYYTSYFNNFVGYVCIISLIGFPFLAGFFSKERIIEGSFWVWKIKFFLGIIISIPLTGYYCFRLLGSKTNLIWANVKTRRHDKCIYFPGIITLVLLAIILGYKLSYISNFSIFVKVKFLSKLIINVLLILRFLASWKNFRFSRLFYSDFSFLKTFNGRYFSKNLCDSLNVFHFRLDLGFNHVAIKRLLNSLENLARNVNQWSLWRTGVNKKLLILIRIILLINIL